MRMEIPWRKNVLVLVIAGYGTLLIIFVAMMWPGGADANVAYEVVKGPLMALIGGSLAISKDLIPLGTESPDAPKTKNNAGNRETNQENDGTAASR